MKKIYALLLILLTAGCSKNEANKKEDQNFDLKEPETGILELHATGGSCRYENIRPKS